MISKTFVADVKAVSVEGGERAVIAYITTDSVDRDHEIVAPGGARLQNYRKNPVVLWMHNHAQPIGKNDWIKREDHGLIAKTTFAETPGGEEVYQLYKQGVLRAFSIGFQPIAMHAPKPDEIKADPRLADCRCVYDKWELNEYSCVSVPANPEALAIAVSKGLKPTLIDAPPMPEPVKVEATPPPAEQQDRIVIVTPTRQRVYRVNPGQLARATVDIGRVVGEYLADLNRKVDCVAKELNKLRGKMD